MHSKLKSLSIIVPVYNEEATLESVLRESIMAAGELAQIFEVIVVDDASRDKSTGIATRLAKEFSCIKLLIHEKNKGLGGTFKSGVERAQYEYITLVPSDGQFDPKDLAKLVAISDADIAVGYRTKRGDTLFRKLVTFTLRNMMLALFGITLRDINWIKLYKRRVFERVKPSYDAGGFEAEMIVKSKRLGLKFKETEVVYLPRLHGVAVGGSIKNLSRTLSEMLKLWFLEYLS